MVYMGVVPRETKVIWISNLKSVMLNFISHTIHTFYILDYLITMITIKDNQASQQLIK